MKKLILIFLCFLSAAAPLMAGTGTYKDWQVESRGGRIFFVTNGTAVEGHEFGFFKDPEGCEDNVLWLRFSSSNEKIKHFLEQGIAILLIVGKKEFAVRPVMVSVEKTDSGYDMAFTNWIPSDEVIKALRKGHSVNVKIIDSPMLEALLNIKEDEFSLMGFSASLRKSRALCRAESKKNSVAENGTDL